MIDNSLGWIMFGIFVGGPVAIIALGILHALGVV